jgi:hypothetical protein
MWKGVNYQKRYSRVIALARDQARPGPHRFPLHHSLRCSSPTERDRWRRKGRGGRLPVLQHLA